MALNLNVQPYFDDFSDDKHFHRILFKPGAAVQARELTQLQSILQDQIEKFGKFVLSDGSRVTGARVFTDTNIRSVSLVETSSLSVDILSFEGKYAVGVTSQLAGLVSSIDYTNFSINVKPINSNINNFQPGESIYIFATKDLALQYLINSEISTSASYTVAVDVDSSISILNASAVKYSNTLLVNTFNVEVGDEITSGSLTQTYSVVEIIDGSTCVVDKKFESTFTNITISATKRASRQVMEVAVDEGIFFTNGFFVKNDSQSIIPNNKTSLPSAVIGFQIVESITDFIDDDSLLDPALGSSNYSAPGADRLAIDLQLVSKPLSGDALSDLTDERFIELVRIKRGEIIKSNLNPKLGELENTLARQMYDHAGNFIVDDFTISFSEEELRDASANTISLQVSPGKAYVFGHEFELSYPYEIQANKARSTASVTDYTLNTYYGNSIQVKDLQGFIDPQNLPTIELHSSNTGHSTTTRVGTAGIRNFKYISSNVYNLYLYDVTLSKNVSIANVRSIAITNTPDTYSSFNFKANTVLTSNNASLSDTLYQKIVFPYQHENIATISNLDYDTNVFLSNKQFASNTTFFTTAGHTIAPGSGTLSEYDKTAYFFLVAQDTSGIYTANTVIPHSDYDVVVNVDQNRADITMKTGSGKWFNGKAKVFYTARYSAAQASYKPKTLVTNKIVAATANTVNVPVSLGHSDVYKVNHVYQIDHTADKYIGVWSGATQYTANDYVSIGTDLYKAAFNSLNSDPTTTTVNDWVKYTPRYSGFVVNNGQKESYYDHGSLTFSNAGDVGKSYVVVFDHFTHGAGGYISKDSYTGISYTDIPSFTDSTGKVIQLRDSIDFRPRRTDLSSTLTFDSYSVPATSFTGSQSDYSYYLSRIDKLVITDNKVLKLFSGEPKYKNFVPPTVPKNSLTLATITYNAYGYTDKDINIAYESHRRYTMDDIGKLDKRINRVEYYTTLSLAESDTLNKQATNSLLNSRLKSGILVDGFTGFAVGDTENPEYRCAIDLDENCCRPITYSVAGALKFDSDALPGNCTNDGILYLPYESKSKESIVASNLQATRVMPCNPFDTISFVGEMRLSPPVDTWFDVETKPVVNVVTDDLKAFAKASENSSMHNATKYLNTSTKAEGSVNIQQSVYNQSTTTVAKLSGTSVSKTVEDIIQNAVPYARSTPVRVIVDGLAPYTKMYAFINGIMVNGFCSSFSNPLGEITSIKIANTGSGYLANSVVTFVDPNKTINTSNASATVNVSGGEIVGVDLVSRGKGYSENVSITVTGTGSNASMVPNVISVTGNDLVTDRYGKLEFTVMIPNCAELKFRTGQLLFSVSDSALNPKAGSSYAESTFFAKGDLKVIQKTITSIRPVVVKNPSGNGNGGNIDNDPLGSIGGNQNHPEFPPYNDKNNCVVDKANNIVYCVVRNGYKIGEVKPTITTTSKIIFAIDSITNKAVTNITLDEYGYCTFKVNCLIVGAGVNSDNVIDGVYSQKVTIVAPVGTIFNNESLQSLTRIPGGNSIGTITSSSLSADRKTLTFTMVGRESINAAYTASVVFAVKLQGDISQFSTYYSGTKSTATLDGSGNVTSVATIPWTLESNQFIWQAQNTASKFATAFSDTDFNTSNFVRESYSSDFSYLQGVVTNKNKVNNAINKANIAETKFDTTAQVFLDLLRSLAFDNTTLTTVSTQLTDSGDALSKKEVTASKSIIISTVKAAARYATLTKAQKTQVIKYATTAATAAKRSVTQTNKATKLAKKLT